MELIIIAVVGVLILFVSGLLVWLIIANSASRRETSAQAAVVAMEIPTQRVVIVVTMYTALTYMVITQLQSEVHII